MPPVSSTQAHHLWLDQRRRHRQRGLCLAIAILFLIDISTGPMRFGLLDIWQTVSGTASAQTSTAVQVLWQLRLPQSLMALLVGACLGLAGAEMQTALDNPLASPFTLGVSSAAAMGAALVLVLQVSLPGVPPSVLLMLAALLSGLLCILTIDQVAKRGQLGTQGIILFGILLVFSFNALLSLTQLLATASSLQMLMFWMMGSLARSEWLGLGALALTFFGILACSIASSGKLTLLRFGDDRAAGLGIHVAHVRRYALIRAGLLASLCVALVGVIGFIGIMAPHIARQLWGEDQRWFLPGSALCGACLLLAASVTSKLLPTATLIPIGIITTLVGIPFFLLALWRRAV